MFHVLIAFYLDTHPVVRLLDHSIFSTLRSLQSVFHNVSASLHSYQYCAGVESFPEHSCVHLSFLFLTIIRMRSNHFGVTSLYISWSSLGVESFCVPVDHLFVSLGELNAFLNWVSYHLPLCL